MTIYNTTYNMTTTFHNTVNGASMVINKGTSDIEVIANLCQGWNIYIIGLSAMTLLMIIGKAILHRMMVQQPKNKDLARLYHAIDGLMDSAIIIATLMQLFVGIYAYMG